jgi:hypothetical protein
MIPPKMRDFCSSSANKLRNSAIDSVAMKAERGLPLPTGEGRVRGKEGNVLQRSGNRRPVNKNFAKLNLQFAQRALKWIVMHHRFSVRLALSFGELHGSLDRMVLIAR